MTVLGKIKAESQPVYWRKTPRPIRSAIKAWDPRMFSLCMGTGVLALQLNQLPYQFDGLRTIAVIGFVADLFLWLFIAAVFVTRAVIFPSSTWELFNKEMDATSYLSCLSIASSTLIDLVFVICGSDWSGWAVACAVLWWVDVGLAILAGVVPYWIMVNHEHVDLRQMAPTLLYPATALCTTAAAGGVVTNSDHLSQNLAIPIVIVSYLLLGMGLFVAILVQAVLMVRFVQHTTPEPPKVPTLFMTLGPLSTSSYAFMLLGDVAGPAQQIFANAAGGSAKYTGDTLFGVGLLFGMLLLGFSTFWLILCMLEVASSFGKSSFSLSTWSALYPMGVYALSINQMSKDFDSPAFRVLATVATCINLLQWLYCAIRLIPLITSGKLFLDGIEPDEDVASEKRPSRQPIPLENRTLENGGVGDEGHDVHLD